MAVILADYTFKCIFLNGNDTGLPVSFEETSFFKKAHLKKVKKRFFSLRIKPLKYADRLKGTPFD